MIPEEHYEIIKESIKKKRKWYLYVGENSLLSIILRSTNLLSEKIIIYINLILAFIKNIVIGGVFFDELFSLLFRKPTNKNKSESNLLFFYEDELIRDIIFKQRNYLYKGAKNLIKIAKLTDFGRKIISSHNLSELYKDWEKNLVGYTFLSQYLKTSLIFLLMVFLSFYFIFGNIGTALLSSSLIAVIIFLWLMKILDISAKYVFINFILFLIIGYIYIILEEKINAFREDPIGSLYGLAKFILIVSFIFLLFIIGARLLEIIIETKLKKPLKKKKRRRRK